MGTATCLFWNLNLSYQILKFKDELPLSIQAPREAFSLFRFAVSVFQSWYTIKSIATDVHASTGVELNKK